MHRIGAAIVVFLFTLSWGRLGAQTTQDLSVLDDILDRASLELGTDLELVVLHRNAVVYRRQTDRHGGVGRLAIASASKWLAASVIQSMVDKGELSWDDPVGLHLHYFREDKAAITLRQLLSHTSGMRGDFECLKDRTKTLDTCVQTIAGEPLLSTPGSAFHYGDPAFQVGGRVAEAVSKRFWEALFQERIALPTGMQFTTFQPDGPTINPDVAAGVSSTTDDYVQFLRMLMDRGKSNGRRVLSRRGIDLMLADQTRGAQVDASSYSGDESPRSGASQNRYGLGNWLEGFADGVSEANSSQGGFGVSPYLDRKREMAFLLFLRDPSGEFNRYYHEIQDVLNEAFPVSVVRRTAEFQVREAGGAAGSRRAHVYAPVPCEVQGAECPALVVFPTSEREARLFAETAGLVELAEREELILLIWDGEDLTPEPGPVTLQDASLAAESLSLLGPMPGVDLQRVYLLGAGRGADLAALAACQDSDAFAAVALVSPELTLADRGEEGALQRICHPQAEVPVLVWGKTPTSSAESPMDHSATLARQQASFWSDRNHCRSHSELVWAGGQSRWTVRFESACRGGASVQLTEGDLAADAWPTNGAEMSWEFLRGFASRVRAQGAAVQTNAASYDRRRTSPGGLASLFGVDLAAEVAVATGPDLPTSLGGVRVELRDPFGVTRDASLIFVSPGQINLVAPEGMAPGIASVFVYRGLELTHLDWLSVETSAPGLFAADSSGEGVAAGEVLYVFPNGSRLTQPLAAQEDADGARRDVPVSLGEPGTEIYLSLYGTGWSGANPEGVRVWMGGMPVKPEYAGRQGFFAGLDQVNLRLDTLPAEAKDALAGRTVPLAVCTAEGCSNRLTVRFQSGAVPRP